MAATPFAIAPVILEAAPAIPPGRHVCFLICLFTWQSYAYFKARFVVSDKYETIEISTRMIKFFSITIFKCGKKKKRDLISVKRRKKMMNMTFMYKKVGNSTVRTH